MTAAHRRLQELSQALPPPVSREVLVTVGHPVDSIAAVAENRDIDLIVMGLTGSGPWFGARPGSIAYGVLSLANAPVLVVPMDRQ